MEQESILIFHHRLGGKMFKYHLRYISTERKNEWYIQKLHWIWADACHKLHREELASRAGQFLRFMVLNSDASLMNMIYNLNFMGMSYQAVTIPHLMCQGWGGGN